MPEMPSTRENRSGFSRNWFRNDCGGATSPTWATATFAGSNSFAGSRAASARAPASVAGRSYSE